MDYVAKNIWYQLQEKQRYLFEEELPVKLSALMLTKIFGKVLYMQRDNLSNT